MSPKQLDAALEEIDLEEEDPFTFPTDREIGVIMMSSPDTPCPSPGPHPSQCTGCASTDIVCPQ